MSGYKGVCICYMAYLCSARWPVFAYFPDKLRRIYLLETVWKVGGGFLIACVSCFKKARWDIFALFWLLAILQIEAYWDFPDSLSTSLGG
jgi:hypothetical protein